MQLTSAGRRCRRHRGRTRPCSGSAPPPPRTISQIMACVGAIQLIIRMEVTVVAALKAYSLKRCLRDTVAAEIGVWRVWSNSSGHWLGYRSLLMKRRGEGRCVCARNSGLFFFQPKKRENVGGLPEIVNSYQKNVWLVALRRLWGGLCICVVRRRRSCA